MDTNKEVNKENNELLGNRYWIKRQLGKGGSGTVYLCYDVKLQKEWAIKKLEDALSIERGMELELLKTISCSFFPRIVDVIKDNGCIFIVMDYVEGISLAEKMKMQLLTEADVLPWALEIAKGILYLHRMRPTVLYMDCKPDNIMLTLDGEIRLVDLGSAYVCLKGKKQRVSGTRFFAPKEQRMGGVEEQPDVRTDIYAFGMTLYYLLTGGKKEWRIKGKLCIKKINPNISWGMSYIIEKCAMENPNNRYQSMEEVLDQLCHIRSLGKWRARKERMNQLLLFLIKAGCVGILLFAALQYRIQGNSVWFFSIFVFGGLLLATIFGKKFTTYEMKRDIFCGSGKRILYVLIAVVGLIGFQYIESYAADGENKQNLSGVAAVKSEEEKLNVILYDKCGRKILIKEGESWEIGEDIIMVVPIEEISQNEGEVRVCYTVKEEEKEYVYKCCRN